MIIKTTIADGRELCIPEDGGVGVLAIEDIHDYRRTVEGLLDVYNGRDENNRTLIFNGKKSLDIRKQAVIVTDVYAYDLSARLLVNALHKHISTASFIDNDKLMTVERDIMQLLQDIDIEGDQKISYQEQLTVTDIVKMMHVSLQASQSHTFIDKLYGIIEISQELLGRQLLIMTDVREMLSPSEYDALLQFVADKHFSVLLLEKKLRPVVTGEHCMNIDSDGYSF